jgi:hypothetical protein
MRTAIVMSKLDLVSAQKGLARTTSKTKPSSAIPNPTQDSHVKVVACPVKPLVGT